MEQCKEPHRTSTAFDIPLALRLVGTESGWERRPGRGLTRAIEINLTWSYSIEL